MKKVFSHSLAVVALVISGCGSKSDRVVVYCAQDEEFATELFGDFNGPRVQPKYDTEANKSVGLLVELEAEKDRPRCDLHWNNEILGTIRLAKKGLYEAYTSPNAAEFPEWTKSKSGHWQAFASRARVLLVNTNLVPEAERPKSILELTDPKWKGRFAIAKPQFGTTATQAACLFEVLGAEKAKEFYRGLKANGVNLVAGNKPVARGVADGTFAIGFTDSDDAIIEVVAGKPVAVIFPDAIPNPVHPRMGTLFIPNTLAIVKGAPNAEGAKKLYDYLLANEQTLASGGGYQLPLNPMATATIHPMLKTPKDVTAMKVDFEKAADLWDETQEFLRNEFAR